MRLIDADALDEKLQALAERYAKQGRIEVANDYNFVATVIMAAPTIEAEPVKHGRWEGHDDYDDDYYHHKCTNCNVDAPFDYEYREDWDEGMDGEWYSLGLVDDGIIEHMTPYCPNCGAKMDLGG